MHVLFITDFLLGFLQSKSKIIDETVFATQSTRKFYWELENLMVIAEIKTTCAITHLYDLLIL